MKQTLKSHVAALLVGVTLLFAAQAGHAASDTATYWQDSTAAAQDLIAAPAKQSLIEVKAKIGGRLSDLIAQIDALDDEAQDCVAAAARLAGQNSEMETTACMIRLESGKIDLFSTVQGALDEISRDLFGIAEAYRLDGQNMRRQIEEAATAESVASQTLDGLKSTARAMLNALDPSALSQEDEQLLRDTVRAIRIAQIDATDTSRDLAAMRTKRTHAETNHDALAHWANSTLNSAKDLDVNIRQSESNIKRGLSWQELAALNEAAQDFPGVLNGMGVILARLGDLGSDPQAEPAETQPAVAQIILPESDVSQLVRDLQTLLGGADGKLGPAQEATAE